MSTTTSAKAASLSDAVPTFRGHHLKKFTTAELAEICVITGEPLSIQESVELVRAGVKIELSAEGKKFAAKHRADFSVLGL